MIAVYCPITAELAEQVEVSTKEYLEFVCPTCGRFRMSPTVLRDHSTNRETLVAALKRAKRGSRRRAVPLLAELLG
jgi:predicted RNA-binding Zn-ribbon protein involved in translation (DUF1610 family)